MKFRYVASGLYAVFLTYSLFALFFGTSGMAAQEKLRSRQKLLSANLSDLTEKQERLSSMLSSLKSSPESVTVGARSLGLVREGDYLVLIHSGEEQWKEPDTGEVLQLNAIPTSDNRFLRILSLLAGLVVFVIAFAAGKGGNAHKARP